MVFTLTRYELCLLDLLVKGVIRECGLEYHAKAAITILKLDPTSVQ